MRSFKRAFNERDDYPTPSCLVTPIIPMVEEYMQSIGRTKDNFIIWCPFDTEDSKYVQLFREAGFTVTASHISEGKDFFGYEPDNWQIAISNPPFSTKLQIFERLCDFGKPFLMLMNMMAINYQNISEFFCKIGTDIQFLIPDKKVSFDGKTSSFNSGYVCYKFLDKTKFFHLENNNSGRFFKE